MYVKQAGLTVPSTAINGNGGEAEWNIDVSSQIGGGKLIGVAFNWATGSACYGSNVQTTSTSAIYVRLVNPRNYAVTVTSIVCTLFYELPA